MNSYIVTGCEDEVLKNWKNLRKDLESEGVEFV